MSFDPHANLAVSTVVTAPSPPTSGTQLVITSGHGGMFPDPGVDGAYNLTVWPALQIPWAGNAEIVRATARSNEVFTILRGQEGSTVRQIVAGDQIAVTVTKKTIDDLQAALLTPFTIPGVVVVTFSGYGAQGGTADDSGAIQDALDDLVSTWGGGLAIYPFQEGQINSTVTVGENAVLVGVGQPWLDTTGITTPATPPGTTITWGGSAGGTMFEVRAGAGAARRIAGAAVRNIRLDGANSAACGVRVRSVAFSDFGTLMVHRVTGVGVELTTESTLSAGPVRNEALNFQALAVRVGMDGGGTSAAGLRLTSAYAANNTAAQGGNRGCRVGIYRGEHHTGTCLEVADANHNVFDLVDITRHGSGTGFGVDLLGTNNLDTGQARANRLNAVQPGAGGLRSRSDGYARPASHNVVGTYSMALGAPLPLIEAGSYLKVEEVISDPGLYARGTGWTVGGRNDGRRTVRYDDEFGAGSAAGSGKVGEHGWTVIVNGAGAAVYQVQSERAHPGIVRLSTGSASGGVACLFLGPVSAGLLHAADWFSLLAIVRANDNSGLTVRVGLAWDPSDSPPADGFWWEGTSAGWKTVARAAGTQSASGFATGLWPSRALTITGDGVTATAKTTDRSPHGFTTGDIVTITGSGGAFDGDQTVTVVNGYTFTFTDTSATTTAATGDGRGWVQVGIDRVGELTGATAMRTAWTVDTVARTLMDATNNPDLPVSPFVQITSSVASERTVDVDWASVLLHGVTR